MRSEAIVAYMLAFVIAMIVAIVMTKNRSNTNPKGIEVEVTSGEVTFSNTDGSRIETIAAGERIAGSTDGTFVKIPNQDVSDATESLTLTEQKMEPTPVSTVPIGILHVHVVDALGDRIRNATLEINGTVYNATDGEAAIEDLPEDSTTLTAYAEGFESIQKVVTLPTNEPVDIELEYLCSFEIRVIDQEYNKPVEGAEVILREGYTPPRPVKDTTAFSLCDNSLEVRWERSCFTEPLGAFVWCKQMDSRVNPYTKIANC